MAGDLRVTSNRILGAGFNYGFVSVFSPFTGLVMPNFELDVPISNAHFIMVNNCLPGFQQSSLMFSLVPISWNGIAGISWPVTGNENLFSFGNIDVPPLITKVGMGFWFAEPLPPKIYLQIGHENGGAPYSFCLFFSSKRVCARSMFAKTN